MKMILKKLRNAYAFFKDMDWEFIIPCIFNHLKYRNCDKRLKAMRHVKYAFFERRFSNILKKYSNSVSSSQVNDGPIWVCWLQGEENMPPIVKRCFERLKLMAPKGRELVLLHWGNLDKYVQIPDYIYKKLRNGTMTYTPYYGRLISENEVR